MNLPGTARSIMGDTVAHRASHRHAHAASYVAGVVALFSIVPLAHGMAGEDAPSRDDLAFFENRVRPVLVEHCQKCHGAKKQESGLRLDGREWMMAGGDRGSAVDLQDTSASLLLKAVRHEGDLKMPPEKKLDAAKIADLAEWIRRGAPWPREISSSASVRSGPITPEERKFWSFQPVASPVLPSLHQVGSARTIIDYLVAAAWEKNGVTPAAAADKRTLIRRATIDLTGLPPDVEDLRAFLADESPDAFERAIDRLLASPAYGERWGRHWLDVVRFADTAGETADYPVREAYRYRNYVIAAFNEDKPYDEFVREQIAGDILARSAPRDKYSELVTATGYLAISRRFGFDSENYQHLTIQDTIDTLGQSFLGLTLGCGRCHDHKFDPVTMSDYYALYGIFESTRYSFPGSEQKQRVRALSPLLPPEESRAAWRNYDGRFAELASHLEAARQPVPNVKVRSLDEPDGDFELQAISAGGSRGVLVPPWMYSGEPLITAAAQSPFKNIYRSGGVGASFPADAAEHAVYQGLPKMTAKESPRLFVSFDFRNAAAGPEATGSHRFYLGHGAKSAAVEIFVTAAAFFIRSGDEIKQVRELKPGQWYQVQLALDLAAGTFQGNVAAPDDAVQFERQKMASGRDGVINFVAFDTKGHLPGPRPAHEIDNFAAATTPFPSVSTSPPPLSSSNESNRPAAEVPAQMHSLLESGPCDLAYSVAEGTPANSRIQKRGEPSKLGDEVPRRWLEILGGDRLQDPEASGRLELARWLTRPENPLTARVMVNRVWQHHFAQGLVATENDFGTRGSRPSHPELLDYLASQFIQHGWSIKQLHRQIMSSRVYQLSSRERGAPGPLLASYPRKRLDAESIRDSLLALSSNLDRSTGGPHPFPPVATWGFTQHNPFTAVYDSRRRSIYLMTQRLKRHPYLALFDGADTNATTPRRLDTTVPTQSLFLMNDPFVHEQSAGLAQKILAAAADDNSRLNLAYEMTLSRQPNADERAADEAFLVKYRELLAATNVPEDQRGPAAWSALARTLITRNEFLFVD